MADAVRRAGIVFGLTHNYTGHPMVRQAREMVAGGELGAVRVVQVEYPQDWLTTRLEETGQKQAAWRTDPRARGRPGCVGDLGTHAFNLAEFVTGLRCESVAADLGIFVPGRPLDDNAHLLLRFAGGARGHAVVLARSRRGTRMRFACASTGKKVAWNGRRSSRTSSCIRRIGERPERSAGPARAASAGRGARQPHPGRPSGGLSGGLRPALPRPRRTGASENGRTGGGSRRVPGSRRTGWIAGVAFIAAAIGSSNVTAPGPRSMRESDLR